MCSLFTPWIPLCICQLPPLPPFFLHSHCLFFLLIWDRGGNIRRERWRMGLKMQIQVISSDIRAHYILLFFVAGWNICLSCLHYFMVNSPGHSYWWYRRDKKEKKSPGDQIGMFCCRAKNLVCRWRRAVREEERVGQTVRLFLASALRRQPTPLSLSTPWELLPPSRSDRKALKTKEEKYKHPLGLLSLLKQDIQQREE